MNEDDDLNEDKTTNKNDEMKVIGKSLRSLSFREKMKGLSPHRRPLKYRIRDKTILYVDLLRPGPPPSTRDDKTFKRLVNRK